MKFLVDTCGWLGWLTDGILADEFANHLNDLNNLIIHTSIAIKNISLINSDMNDLAKLRNL